MDELILEYLQFPKSPTKDILDALEMAVRLAVKYIGERSDTKIHVATRR
jgi:hypothetical protein